MPANEGQSAASVAGNASSSSASASAARPNNLRRFSTELRPPPAFKSSAPSKKSDASSLERAFSELELQSDEIKATFMDLLEEAGPDAASRSTKAKHIMDKVDRVSRMAEDLLSRTGKMSDQHKDFLATRFVEIKRLIGDAARAADDPDATRIIVSEKLGIIEEAVENAMRDRTHAVPRKSAGVGVSVPRDQKAANGGHAAVAASTASAPGPRSSVQDLIDLDPYLRPYQGFLENR
jgi:hypothetical protein